MKQKKVNRVALLLHWAGEQKVWLFLAVFLSAAGGLCIVVPYMGIYQLMDAAFSGTCTRELVVRIVAMIAPALTLRFVLFGGSGVAAQLLEENGIPVYGESQLEVLLDQL